jgi:hypothetical protein
MPSPRVAKAQPWAGNWRTPSAKKAGTAATSLGLTILLTVLWIYLPMLLAAPTEVVALNFFFDTLLFCGAIVLLADSIDKMKNKVGTLLS